MTDGAAPPVTAERLAAWFEASPAIKFLQLSVVAIDAAGPSLTVRMPMRHELQRGIQPGQFHGGPIATLIDTVGDFAVAMVTGGPVPTINMRVDYLRPATGDYLEARATVRRAGRTVCVCDIDVVDSQQRLCAIGRATYSSVVG